LSPKQFWQIRKCYQQRSLARSLFSAPQGNIERINNMNELVRRTTRFALIPSIFVLITGCNGASNSAPKQLTPVPAAATTKKASEPPPIVSEITALIVSPRSTGSGTVTISTKTSDCNPVEVRGKVNVGRGYKGRQDDFSGVMYLPGVEHKFIGNVCLFAKGTRFRETGGVEGNVEFGDHADLFSGGVLVGPATIQVTANFGKLDAAAMAKLFQISSDASDPLVLKVTPTGYEYVSGVGILQAPSGKSYSFHR
jgi:hypothetical protein